MLKFIETKDGYVFEMNNKPIAVGAYEPAGFTLLHDDDVMQFSNAMQAFTHLRSIHDRKLASQKTIDLFTTPSRAIDNMSKWYNSPALENMPKEVFHANLHS